MHAIHSLQFLRFQNSLPNEKNHCLLFKKKKKTLLLESPNKTLFGPHTHKRGDPLAINLCHESNGIDYSLMQVFIIILWRVATHFQSSLRDTW